ncbi:uncharacterized protein LOC132299757 isoform X2 [Cornus florida]|uniref:uncharacterized protein LOC132299757 isoform X2 n=1 Tax=Cornus florida TaxID=4283 RepID=UPI0028A25357|nr:uncharacterized protein LOC132299757 isoform X2 [Cornus florida]
MANKASSLSSVFLCSQSIWVEAQTTCNHLASLSFDLTHIPALDTPCNRCLHPDDNWLCLCCKAVLYSRKVNKHMLSHFLQSKHCVVLGYCDLSVYCYPCNAYLDAQVILPLRPIYESAYRLKFGEDLDWQTEDKEVEVSTSGS